MRANRKTVFAKEEAYLNKQTSSPPMSPSPPPDAPGATRDASDRTLALGRKRGSSRSELAAIA